ncbi:MAG: M23 family metallopeptidase [Candidatus Improbicoccus pseudotrichonymphae]|uniref:M23 family metallopeptidase n=1 Tax=Candidatus Improbicoccus pseudotrichonymphae TaxID=3033792 RepID=A0AA48KY72_9FIRM|nr:MAG: M23 family metallopeptidase [Candidatus Improbicoccus pseudotrichonymphae]
MVRLFVEKKDGKGNSFRIIASICVFVILIAVFSTYKNVNDFINSTVQEKYSVNDGNNNNSFKDGAANEPENVREVLNQNLEPEIVFPIENGGKVIKKFSTNPVYSVTHADWRAHMGVDIEANPGSKVVAITAGKVENIRQDDNYGTVVEIFYKIPGLEVTVFCSNVSDVKVEKGQNVVSGQEIGVINKNPSTEIADSKGHLHLGAMKNKALVDPIIALPMIFNK